MCWLKTRRYDHNLNINWMEIWFSNGLTGLHCCASPAGLAPPFHAQLRKPSPSARRWCCIARRLHRCMPRFSTRAFVVPCATICGLRDLVESQPFTVQHSVLHQTTSADGANGLYSHLGPSPHLNPWDARTQSRCRWCRTLASQRWAGGRWLQATSLAWSCAPAGVCLARTPQTELGHTYSADRHGLKRVTCFCCRRRAQPASLGVWRYQRAALPKSGAVRSGGQNWRRETLGAIRYHSGLGQPLRLIEGNACK